MAKETFYFSHDYNSRNDVKVKKLLSKHGLLGYGIFWALIEELYNNTNVLPLDYETISFDLRIDAGIIESIICDFDLFIIDVNENSFGSLSVQNRINERNLKSQKARDSIAKRWNDTNVKQSNNDTNTIKERKIKERKGKESKTKDLIYPFNSLIFINLWNVLISQPKWKNKTIDALQGNLKTLSEVPEPIALEMMQNTINNGWQGVFLPKNNLPAVNQVKTAKINESINAFEEAKQKIIKDATINDEN